MIEPNDWRLNGQEKYLSGETLHLRKMTPSRKDWDHEHCEFCWEKISPNDGDIHEAYTTSDEYYWICPECFEDFKETFDFKLSE